MPAMNMVVALWNRDTQKKQMGTNPERIQQLKAAVSACDIQFARILKANQAIRGVFVAPEYYFAGDKAGIGQAGGGFHERCIDETAKDFLVAEMRTLSRKFPKVLLIPGTIAWSKSLQRAPGQEYKRDPQTNLRTNVLKTTPDRITNVGQTLQASINAGGTVGGLLPTELLRTKVRKELAAASPNGLVSPMAVGQAVRAIMHQPKAGVDTELLNRFGTTAGMYRTVGDQFDTWNLIQNGTATHIMKNTAFLYLNGQIRFKYNKRNDFHESVSDTGQTVFCPGAKSGFTTIEGIDIGLEICLDHAVGQLQNTPLPPSGVPMLHILTSAAVQPNHPRVRTGGYFIHASSVPAWATVSQWTAGGWADAEFLEQKTIGGDPLDLYKITLNVP